MNKGNKKIIGVLLCMTFIMSLIAGCSTNRNAQNNTKAVEKQTAAVNESLFNEPGKLPIVKEPVTLTVGIKESLVTDFKNNAYTKWIANQTGIQLEFVTYPTKGAEAQQKFDLAVTSNQKLPDILVEFGFNSLVLYNYGKSGILFDTTDFLKNKAYYFNQELKKVPNGETIKSDIFKFNKSPDGKLYGYPALNEANSNMWDGRWYINKKWLDTLKLSYPKTTDEFYTVLKAFKEKDPNGNGKADEIPLMGSSNGYRQQPENIILNSFLYVPYDNKLLNSGKVSMAYTQPEYREALRYLNKLTKEQLFSPISFTQDDKQLKAMLDLPEDKVTLVGMFAGSPTGLFAVDNKKKQEYSGDFDIIKGPKGVAYTPYTPAYPLLGSYVTKYCNNPEAAMRLLDFMWTEEASIRLRYGEKGVNWDYLPEGTKSPLEANGVKALFWQDNKLWGSSNNSIWGVNGPAFLPVRISDGHLSQQNVDDPLSSVGMIIKSVKHLVGHSPKEIMPNLIFTKEEQDEFTELETVISTFTKEVKVRFIVGDMNINDDKVWNDYLSELNNMGFKRYLEIMQSAYDRMSKK